VGGRAARSPVAWYHPGMIRVFRTLALAGALAAALSSETARADAPVAQRFEPPTDYEQILAESCNPCVRESFPVTSVHMPPVPLPSGGRMPNAVIPRPSEIALEALRAYPLGQPERQFMAMRVSLFVAAGGVAEPYRLAVGLIDESALPTLSGALAQIAQLPPDAGESGPASAEIDYQSGSVRMGLVRFKRESAAYVQVGDPATVLGRRPLEVPTGVFFPTGQLPALVKAIDQVIAKLRSLRAPR